MKKVKFIYKFIIAFYLLNIINTYFITTSLLNKYVISFSRSFLMEINAFVGNFAFLTIFLFIGFLIFKKSKSRIIYLILLTLSLNILIYSLGVFTKYYQTVFSIQNMDVFKNPATELGFSILFEALKELFVYFRIVVFIPTIILTTLYFIYKKQIIQTKTKYSLKCNFSGLLAGILISTLSLGMLFIRMNKNWIIDTERALYGTQNGGVYNYYLSQMLGISSNRKNDINDLSIYDKYNKNTSNYKNYFNETFSNNLLLEDANNLVVDQSIKKDSLNGIFKDKNLVLVHVESLNHFILDESEESIFDENYLKTFKAILKESYLFDNFYTNVGVGNSSDAEFSVNTGLLAKGDATIYWDYNDEEFSSLAKLFKDYYTASLHGDVKEFYNREVVHKNMLGFQDYFYYSEKEKHNINLTNGFYMFEDLNDKTDESSPWLSDLSLIDWTSKVFKEEEKNFLYPIMIQPHVPYLYYDDNNYFDKDEVKVSSTTLRYLNYESYLEDYFNKFLNSTLEMPNTVYIFYSDHGSSIPYNDVLTILGKTKEEYPYLKYEQEMLRTLAFIYYPSTELNEDLVYEGMFKGVQPLVRSQIDLYRTIVELFDLETNNYYFGVNGISKERTFAVDTRTFSLITDEYYLVPKRINNNKKLSKDNIYPYKTEYEFDPIEFNDYAMKFKYDLDAALKNNLFHKLKND